MSCRWMVACALVLGGLLAVNSGCLGGKPKRIKPPPIDASAAGSKAVEMFDADKDGKISGDELNKCPGLKAAAVMVDLSGQNAITADAIAARVKKWQESKLGRMSLSCMVTRNGQPFAGAEVKFVPEKFLGEEIQPAAGKTDQNGMAMLTIAGTGPGNPPGVAPGMYRVVITKQGVSIPPKYSSEDATTLGQEVAQDAKGIQEGIKFNLKF